MATSERGQGQNDDSISNLPVSSETTQADPLEGVTDPKFRSFMIGVPGDFVPVGDGLFGVYDSVGNIFTTHFGHRDIDLKGIPGRVTPIMTILEDEGFLQTKRVLQTGENKDNVIAADEEHMLRLASYLFAHRDVDQAPVKMVKNGSSMLPKLTRMAELWGDNVRVSGFKENVTRIKTHGFRNKRPQPLSKQESVVTTPFSDFATARRRVEIPPLLPEYKAITADRLGTVLDEFRKSFPRRDVTERALVAKFLEEQGLTPEILWAIDFVCLRNRPIGERGSIPFGVIMERVEHCEEEMRKSDKKAREILGEKAKFRTNLDHLCKARIKEIEGRR